MLSSSYLYKKLYTIILTIFCLTTTLIIVYISITPPTPTLPPTLVPFPLVTSPLIYPNKDNCPYYPFVDYTEITSLYTSYFKQQTIDNFNTKYTLIILTLSTTPRQHIERLVQGYIACSNLHKLIFVWNPKNPADRLPVWFIQLKHFSHQKIRIEVATDNSLLNRFKLYDSIDTDIIVSSDDDILFDCPTLAKAAEITNMNPSHFLSFFPRRVICTQDLPQYSWNSARETTKYNLGLTKGSVSHRQWYKTFWKLKPHLHNFVHENFNCEDILFAFQQYNETKLPNIIVQAYNEHLEREGLSQRKVHDQGRTDCINYFAKEFGGMPPTAKGFITFEGYTGVE